MRFDDLLKRTFVKGSLSQYDPSTKKNAVLADDFRILAAWWATGASKYPKKQIEDCLVKILKEIAARVKRGQMNWHLHPDRLKSSTKKLVNKVLRRLEEDEARVLIKKEG